MACHSGYTDLNGVEHFLRIGEKTDPDEQQCISDRFFTQGTAATHLDFNNDTYGTCARFMHQNDAYEWHEQLGTLDYGDQQVFPAGEIACFLVPLDTKQLRPDTRFTLNGQLVLKGHCIVQSGSPSFLRQDQERIYQQLCSLQEHAVIIDVKQGDIINITASNILCQPAARILRALIDIDSRFGRLYEIGFAINRHLVCWPGNTAMNEVYGGAFGTIHIGLGMLPHTQYHIDIFCEGTRVLNNKGETIFGTTPGKSHTQDDKDSQQNRLKSKRSAACPCITI